MYSKKKKKKKTEQSIYEFESKLLLISIRNIEKLKWSQQKNLVTYIYKTFMTG